MTIKDILGADDYCMMRVGDTSTFACLDCESVLGYTPTRLSEAVTLIKMTDD